MPWIHIKQKNKLLKAGLAKSGFGEVLLNQETFISGFAETQSFATGIRSVEERMHLVNLLVLLYIFVSCDP